MYLEASAKSGENVEEAFLKCCKTILAKIQTEKNIFNTFAAGGNSGYCCYVALGAGGNSVYCCYAALGAGGNCGYCCYAALGAGVVSDCAKQCIFPRDQVVYNNQVQSVQQSQY
ncbi:Ras- protein Rab-4A [Homalodisca vitripennis]|nr:Ras- protein Rab-4A [Homalodisca vitripennis]